LPKKKSLKRLSFLFKRRVFKAPLGEVRVFPQKTPLKCGGFKKGGPFYLRKLGTPLWALSLKKLQWGPFFRDIYGVKTLP